MKKLPMLALALGIIISASQAQAGESHHNNDYRKFKKIVNILDHVFDEPHHRHIRHKKTCYFSRYEHYCRYHKRYHRPHYKYHRKHYQRHYVKKPYCAVHGRYHRH